MMKGLVKDSATVGLAKRAARPTRRSVRLARRSERMTWGEIAGEFANAARILKARWDQWRAGR